LFGNQVLLHNELLSASLFKLSLAFEKLLLLLHGFFHFFVASQELLFHVFDLLKELLLLALLLLLGFLLHFEICEQFFPFLFSHGSLCLNFLPLFFELLADRLFVFL
jgi:hypothetical protein